MVNKILNKKSVIIAMILALCLSMTAFVSLTTKAYADETLVDEKPTANVVLDMDLTAAWLEKEDGTKIEKVTADNTEGLNFFGGDGSTKMSWTDGNSRVNVKFAKKYKAEYFDTVEVKIAVCVKGTVTGYKLGTTESAGSIDSNGGNGVTALILKAALLADENGYIQGFTYDNTGANSNDWFDYVELVLAEEKPTNILLDMDGNQAWLEANNDKGEWSKATNVNRDNIIHEAFGDYRVFPSADGTTKITWVDNIGNGDLVHVRLAQKVKAEYYEKVKINLCIGSAANGNELHGGMSTITGYAVSDTTFTTPAGKMKTGGGNVTKVLSLDPSVLADSDGYIDTIVLRRTETNEAVKGSIFADYVEFCLVGSEPKPVVSEEYIEKDISEVMPAGSGVTFNVKTDAENLNKTTVQSAVKTAAFDKLNFKITPNANGKFSTYVLMKAPTATSTYEDGGIFFWISNDNVVIGNKENSESAVQAEFPENAFVSGQTTTVSIAAIPYYLDGTHAGYYCAIYVNGSENALVEIYLDITTCETGVYTNILTQDLGNDYDVVYASASETPKSAAEVMNVKLATTSEKTEFTKPRAGLTLSHFEVAGETVGDLVIEGDATFDADTKFLTFTKEGTVKVYYTVKNAFGEFKSNELTLTYATGKPTGSGDSQSGCLGSVTSASVLSVFAVAAAAVIAKKKKND